MNKDRRKEIVAASALVDEAQDLLEQAKGILETIRDEEQEYYDNMPESLQGGDKGSAAEEAIGNLDTAIEEIENFDCTALSRLAEASNG